MPDAVERGHLLHHSLLEVGADRAAWRGERDDHLDATVVQDLDRADHAEVDDALAKLGVDHRAQGFGHLFLAGHALDSGKHGEKGPPCLKRRRRGPKAPPAEGGEVLRHCRRETSAGSTTPRPGTSPEPGAGGSRLRQVRRHARHDVAGAALEVTARGAHLRLDVAAVAPDEPLDLCAVALDLPLQLIAGRGATTLVLAEVRGDPALELRDLALGGRATGER